MKLIFEKEIGKCMGPWTGEREVLCQPSKAKNEGDQRRGEEEETKTDGGQNLPSKIAEAKKDKPMRVRVCR